MKLPTNFSFTKFIPEVVFLLRDIAYQVNRLSDAIPFIQQFSTGSNNHIVRLLTASAALDFPLIAAGAVATLDIPATGARIGDYPMVSPPSTLEAGLTYSVLIAVSDKVTVRVFNGSGAGVDPASATWKALVVGIG